MSERRGTDRMVVVCTGLCLLCVVVVGVFAVTVLDTSSRADDIAKLAAQNEERINDIAALARENARLAGEIQKSRERACQEGNKHHDAVIATFDRLIDDLPAGARKRRAVRNRKQTLVLLEAIAPRQDCAKVVRGER